MTPPSSEQCQLCGAEVTVTFEHDTHLIAHCAACLDHCLPLVPKHQRRQLSRTTFNGAGRIAGPSH